MGLILGAPERPAVASGGFAVAFGLHVAFLAFAILTSLLAEIKTAMADERHTLHNFFWREYDVEIDKPKDPPKEEDPAPPEPPAAAPPAPVAKSPVKPVEEDPYKGAPPPTPSKASKMLTADPKPDDPVELPTIVSADGTALGGVQSADGRGDRVTNSKNATLNGVAGGKGSGTAPAPPGPATSEDHSRPISLVGGAWRCPFPPEANDDQIDHAVVGIMVTVRPDGSPASVSVMSDPGHGFGRAARSCAMSSRYNPALDRSGTAVLQSQQVNVTFRR